MKGDNKAIFSATSTAEKVTDVLAGLQPVTDETQATAAELAAHRR